MSRQVTLMLDCTASMTDWIEASKRKLLEVTSHINSQYSNYEIEFSFIGYRDFEDETQFITLPFTTNYQSLVDKIETVEAIGGGDECEDVSGAYYIASECQVWDADVKILFHITDAPDHGVVLHDHTVSDYYPEGHPTVNLLEMVKNLAKNNVDITFFKLNNSTNVMTDAMRNTYSEVREQGFTIRDFTKSNKNVKNMFYDVLTQQIELSMTQHLSTDTL
jgi:hypothetical protein